MALACGFASHPRPPHSRPNRAPIPRHSPAPSRAGHAPPEPRPAPLLPSRRRAQRPCNRAREVGSGAASQLPRGDATAGRFSNTSTAPWPTPHASSDRSPGSGGQQTGARSRPGGSEPGSEPVWLERRSCPGSVASQARLPAPPGSVVSVSRSGRRSAATGTSLRTARSRRRAPRMRVSSTTPISGRSGGGAGGGHRVGSGPGELDQAAAPLARDEVPTARRERSGGS
jgi:hypothetical protein